MQTWPYKHLKKKNRNDGSAYSLYCKWFHLNRCFTWHSGYTLCRLGNILDFSLSNVRNDGVTNKNNMLPFQDPSRTASAKQHYLKQSRYLPGIYTCHHSQITQSVFQNQTPAFLELASIKVRFKVFYTCSMWDGSLSFQGKGTRIGCFGVGRKN